VFDFPLLLDIGNASSKYKYKNFEHLPRLSIWYEIPKKLGINKLVEYTNKSQDK